MLNRQTQQNTMARADARCSQQSIKKLAQIQSGRNVIEWNAVEACNSVPYSACKVQNMMHECERDILKAKPSDVIILLFFWPSTSIPHPHISTLDCCGFV